MAALTSIKSATDYLQNAMAFCFIAAMGSRNLRMAMSRKGAGAVR